MGWKEKARAPAHCRRRQGASQQARTYPGCRRKPSECHIPSAVSPTDRNALFATVDTNEPSSAHHRHHAREGRRTLLSGTPGESFPRKSREDACRGHCRLNPPLPLPQTARPHSAPRKRKQAEATYRLDVRAESGNEQALLWRLPLYRQRIFHRERRRLS